MNLERVDQIVKAVLYEGYMLYPYRPSSVKNRQRWNFGVVYPQAYEETLEGTAWSSMRTECLINGHPDTVLEVKVRFLHLRWRSAASPGQASGSLPEGWQEAIEREVSLPKMNLAELSGQERVHHFAFPAETKTEREADRSGQSIEVVRHQAAIAGDIHITSTALSEGLFKLSVTVHNTTPLTEAASDREATLLQSLVSTHTILGVQAGEFLSLLEPPDECQSLAAECQNVGVWPVLVGEPGQRDTLLASPIILYDYPQIAPESVGDLFDGTEIDEILSLRIMTLTDDEKREMRDSDERARQILERTENMPTEQFMKLHGVVRGMRPLKEDAS